MDKAIIIFSYVSALVVLLFGITSEYGYDNIVVLPVTYGTMLLILPEARIRISNSIGELLYKIILGIRSVILPLVIVLTGDFTGAGVDPSSSFLATAIWLMWLEIIVSLLSLHILAKCFHRAEGQINPERLPVIPKGSAKFYLAVSGLAAILGFASPSVLESQMSMWVDSPNTLEDLTTLIGFLAQHMWDLGRFALLVVLLHAITKPYATDRNNAMVVTILSTVVVFAYVLTNPGMNRGALVSMAFASAILLSRCVPVYRKQVIVAVLISMTVPLLIISGIRTFESQSRGFGALSIYEQSREMSPGPLLQAYVAGPRNIAFSLEMHQVFAQQIFGINTLIADILNPVPILGKAFREISTPSLFNYTLYMGSYSSDQIIPLIGQAYATLGWIGVICIPFFCVALAMWFGERARLSKFGDQVYAFSIASVWFGLAGALNLSILSQQLLYRCLPIFVLTYLVHKCCGQLGGSGLRSSDTEISDKASL